MKKIFTEIGFDPDHHRYLIGVSTEIENEDGSETRQAGFHPMKFCGCYLRIWIFKTVFVIGIPCGFSTTKKNRLHLKFIFGIKGIL
ncbi:MAG: DUF3977 family protein [Chthoniobacterales bacterium]